MKRKLTEDREKTKIKRQLGIAKKKKSKLRKEKKSININDILFDRYQDVVISISSEVEIDDEAGPGYMGWRSPNDDNDAIMKAFDEIRKDVQELKTADIKKSKQIKSLEIEVKNLKEEYTQCLEALSKETYERNKAEELNKIIMETIEAENKQKTQEDDVRRVETSEEEMLVEEQDVQAWSKPKDHVRNEHEKSISYKCNFCVATFKIKSDLEKHIKSHHENKISFKCESCQLSYKTPQDLDKHTRSVHVGNIAQKEDTTEHELKCETCNKTFKEEERLRDHMITIHAEKVFTCQICNKSYCSMGLLRRHDWRSHREIDCNICGETIQSRQDIKSHRQTEHQMFNKVFCKYFPACLDGDECFFEHEKDYNVSDTNDGLNCPNGERCADQSCKFSEQRHTVTILCKFQANCKRLNCPYKHNVPRKAFLEQGSIKYLIN